jgi:hypothetical protein
LIRGLAVLDGVDSRLTIPEELRLICSAFDADEQTRDGHASHETELLPGCSNNGGAWTVKMEIRIRIQILEECYGTHRRLLLARSNKRLLSSVF